VKVGNCQALNTKTHSPARMGFFLPGALLYNTFRVLKIQVEWATVLNSESDSSGLKSALRYLYCYGKII